MNYEKGFKDAVELFEKAIDRTILSGEYNLDAVISTLYIIRLKWEEIYEKAVIESIGGDCSGDCDDCDIGVSLEDIFKKILEGVDLNEC